MAEEEDYYVAQAGGSERFNRVLRDEAERKFRGYLWHCQQRGEVKDCKPEDYATNVLGRAVKRDLSDVTKEEFARLKAALNKARNWNDE